MNQNIVPCTTNPGADVEKVIRDVMSICSQLGGALRVLLGFHFFRYRGLGPRVEIFSYRPWGHAYCNTYYGSIYDFRCRLGNGLLFIADPESGSGWLRLCMVWSGPKAAIPRMIKT